jgi:hypothetical protein
VAGTPDWDPIVGRMVKNAVKQLVVSLEEREMEVKLAMVWGWRWGGRRHSWLSWAWAVFWALMIP